MEFKIVSNGISFTNSEHDIELLEGSNFFESEFSIDFIPNVNGLGSFLNRISFNQKVYQFSLYIKSVEILKNLQECVSLDRVYEKPTKIYINDAYIQCYITRLENKNFRNIVVDIEASSLLPLWTKEEHFEFLKFEDEEVSNNLEGLSFPFSFPFNFTQTRTNKSIINKNPSKSPVEFIFYGPLLKVDIGIGTHRYKVDSPLLANERLIINQRKKTITKITVSGDHINMMNYRDKEESVFKEVDPGEHAVSFSGEFSFEIILFDERSEPVWN